MRKKKLPIGIQTFSEIRKESYIYIDKTDLAVGLMERYKYVFLSRPRRFGKSLFLDTLKELFEGNKELFSGLAAEKLYDWAEVFPVIHISFGRGDFYEAETIRESIIYNLAVNEERFEIPSGRSNNPTIRFNELISAVYKKYRQKVVVLIDEYDKPILDNLGNRQTAEEARTILRVFYTVLKGNDAIIRFAFLTGVSKFSKVSIFSGLNNLTDISLHKDYGTICGYTQPEMEEGFAEYLPGVDRTLLKRWYNGYNFLGENVYNPFDILLFFDSYDFRSYWFETGTPNVLIEQIKKERYFLPRLSGIFAGEELLNSFDIDNIDLITMLFQTGYLTIKDFTRRGPLGRYSLDFPNLEVSSSLMTSLLPLFSNNREKITLKMDIFSALEEGNPEPFRKAMDALFASIPYNNYNKNDIARYEGFYASVIYAWLAASHLSIVVEDCTSKGRIDMMVEFDATIYIIEFKVDAEGKALSQIKEKKYSRKYQDKEKEIILIGISFDSQEKNIKEFLWERG